MQQNTLNGDRRMSDPTPQQQQLASTLIGIQNSFVVAHNRAVEIMRPAEEAFARDMANFAEALRRTEQRPRG